MNLIDRQAAIDALEREKTYCTAFRDGYAKTNVFEKYNRGLTDGIKAIKKLPSAQPEIIRCKDCKYFEHDHIENVKGAPLIVAHEICTRWCNGAKTSEDGYCFLAERKGNG